MGGGGRGGRVSEPDKLLLSTLEDKGMFRSANILQIGDVDNSSS